MKQQEDDFINKLIKQEIDRQPQKDGFFPLDIFKKHNPLPLDTCNDLEHEPPRFLNIPQGMGYRHKCPKCGKNTTIIPPQITM